MRMSPLHTVRLPSNPPKTPRATIQAKRQEGFDLIIGVDEAGRGPFAGEDYVRAPFRVIMTCGGESRRFRSLCRMHV